MAHKKTLETRVKSLQTQHRRLLGDVSLLNAREREYGARRRVLMGEQLEVVALKRIQRQKKSLLGLVNRQLDELDRERFGSV